MSLAATRPVEPRTWDTGLTDTALTVLIAEPRPVAPSFLLRPTRSQNTVPLDNSNHHCMMTTVGSIEKNPRIRKSPTAVDQQNPLVKATRESQAIAMTNSHAVSVPDNVRLTMSLVPRPACTWMRSRLGPDTRESEPTTVIVPRSSNTLRSLHANIPGRRLVLRPAATLQPLHPAFASPSGVKRTSTGTTTLITTRPGL